MDNIILSHKWRKKNPVEWILIISHLVLEYLSRLWHVSKARAITSSTSKEQVNRAECGYEPGIFQWRRL